jgi:glycosyltransferase involved in cell wall biosynthesis
MIPAEKRSGVAYILSKNEEANIDRCLEALNKAGLTVVVLDSGSTDRTIDIAREYGAIVEHYDYVDHCAAYNDITSSLSEGTWCLVLDADMIVSEKLVNEIGELIETNDVVKAPVKMVYGGKVLDFASLYPPKPIAFRGGKEYFVPVGHGERLKAETKPVEANRPLIHDDRESFSDYVQKQIRYADAFIARSNGGQSTLKDKIRRKTPLGILAAPFISLFVKGGILDGKPGIMYAIDRLISEAIKYRKALEDDID